MFPGRDYESIERPLRVFRFGNRYYRPVQGIVATHIVTTRNYSVHYFVKKALIPPRVFHKLIPTITRTITLGIVISS